jgi:hypothetical protein
MNKNLDPIMTLGIPLFIYVLCVLLVASHKHTPKFERDCSIFEHSLGTSYLAGYDPKDLKSGWSQERYDLAEMGTRIANLESVNRCLLDVINQ